LIGLLKNEGKNLSAVTLTLLIFLSLNIDRRYTSYNAICLSKQYLKSLQTLKNLDMESHWERNLQNYKSTKLILKSSYGINSLILIRIVEPLLNFNEIS